MSEMGELRHEVVKEDGTGLPLLHVYLPEGLSFSDVEVTTGSSTDVAEVFIEHVATESVLGLITLQGYTVAQDDSVVKFSKKHRRYTIRLSEAAPVPVADTEPPACNETAAAAVPAAPADVSEALPGKASGSPTSSVPLAGIRAPEPASVNNIFGVLDNDEVSDDGADGGAEGAAGAAKKKKKKKKKGKKAGTGAGGEGQVETEAPEVPTANGSHGSSAAGAGAEAASSGDEHEAVTTAGGEGGANAGKKKKKKKKGGAAAAATSAAAEGGAEMGGTEAEVQAEEEGLPSRSSPPAPTPPEPETSQPSSPAAESMPVSMPTSAPTSAPISKYASRALSVDLVADFLPDPFGSFEVGAAVEHDPLMGPAVHNGLGKVAVKNEDKCLEAPSNSWFVKELEGAVTPVSAFGIFDGHGGRMAAQYAAKSLLPLVARFAERAVGPEAPVSEEQLAAEGYMASDQAESGKQTTDREAALRRARVAAAQDGLIARLPKALHAGFVQCDEDVISRHKTSGTTATLAVQVGWELLVANVGDSLAYLDTGSEIVVISANHRVAESTEEQERIVKAGGRIKPAKYGEDEDPSEGQGGSATPHEGQQLRVWPGGINMTRTIGDESAKGLLIPEPAIRQISLPVTGARLIIASDGLWDSVNAKTVIGQLRTCNAREAASKAAVYAMRNKKHDDDVTVVVADFVPRQSDTHVPGLLKRTAGPAAAALSALAAAGMKEERAAQSWRPLETPSESWRERHRAHRRRAAAYLEQLDLAEEAEKAAEEELARQRRMAVAPAAGTAGVGTAIRPPPVSDTYRELAELRVCLASLNDEPADADEDWTQVDAKKKKDGGGFDLRKELMKAARPGEGRQARSPSGGPGTGGGREERLEAGGRRERRERGGPDRERRPLRRERNGGPAADSAAGAAAADAAEGVAAQQPVPQLPPPQQQQQPRGERRERFDRRDRGGRGGRGREGGGRGGGSTVQAEGGDAAIGTAVAAPSARPGVVKAGGYLFVPKSLLTGGGAAAAAPSVAPDSVEASGAAGESGAGGTGGIVGKPRKDRGPRRNRREGGPAPYAPDGAEGEGDVAEPAAAAEDGAAPMTSGARRSQQRRKQKEREREKEVVASAAAAVAMGGLSAASAGRPAVVGAAAAPQAQPTENVAVARSSDPVVVLEPSAGHSQRRQHNAHATPHAGAPYAAPQGAGATASAPHYGRPAQQHGLGGHAAIAPAATGASQAVPAGAHYSAAQHQHHSQSQHQPLHQTAAAAAHPQQPQSRAAAPSAPAPAAVPMYAGPLDFGAGFGPGSSMWPPAPGGGAYGGFSANGGAAAPQRPPGLGGGPPQRSPSEVAAAAAAAAAAAVARKTAAAKSGGGAAAAPYGQGRT